MVANGLRAIVATWTAYRGKTLLHPDVLVTFLNDMFIRAAPASPRQIEMINAAAASSF